MQELCHGVVISLFRTISAPVMLVAEPSNLSLCFSMSFTLSQLLFVQFLRVLPALVVALKLLCRRRLQLRSPYYTPTAFDVWSFVCILSAKE